MKKILLISGILTIFSSLNAQDVDQSCTKAEKLLKSPDKIIASYPVYSSKTEKADAYRNSEYSLILFKAFEIAGNDTILGVAINNINNLFQGDGKLYKINQGYLDYEEINKIISWIDFCRKEMDKKNNSKINYISYSPKQGKVLLYFNRVSKEKYYFSIRTDKDDLGSQIDFDMNLVDKLYLSLKEIQKFIEETVK